MAELIFLGTGAADWEIAHKGADFRRNSAALLDGVLMLDCGAHIFDFAADFGTSYDSVTDILITHNHSDHVSRDSVRALADRQKIRLGCDRAVRDLVGEHENIEWVQMMPYHTVDLGGYRVTPMLANHDNVADGENFSFHYQIDTPDGKTIFYGLDGAWLLRPTWNEMLKHRYDLILLDCTVGDQNDWRMFEHNTIPMLREQVREIRAQGLLKAGGMLVASHLARTLHLPHAETRTILQEFGMDCAYDGMTLTI